MPDFCSESQGPLVTAISSKYSALAVGDEQAVHDHGQDL